VKVQDAYPMVSVRVPPETYAALKRLADKGDRPLTGEVRRALRDHIERESETENRAPAR
jgi:predicted transcriptional regulator